MSDQQSPDSAWRKVGMRLLAIIVVVLVLSVLIGIAQVVLIDTLAWRYGDTALQLLGSLGVPSAVLAIRWPEQVLRFFWRR